MKTIPYTMVLQHAAELSGRSYDDGQGNIVLSAEDSIVFRTLIGQALRRAWTYQPWPETTFHTFRRWAETWALATSFEPGSIVWWPVTEAYYVVVSATATSTTPTYSLPGAVEQIVRTQTWFKLDTKYSADEWSSDKTYTVGDLVYSSITEQHYVLKSTAPATTVPTHQSYWYPVPFIERRIELEQEWEDQSMGDPFGIYLQNPLTQLNPNEATYTWDGEGIRILDEVDGVYIHAWKPVPEFYSDPATVPHRFGQYASLTAAGFMLRGEGKVDQGNQLLKLGEDLIADEASNVTRTEYRSGRLSIR